MRYFRVLSKIYKVVYGGYLIFLTMPVKYQHNYCYYTILATSVTPANKTDLWDQCSEIWQHWLTPSAVRKIKFYLFRHLQLISFEFVYNDHSSFWVIETQKLSSRMYTQYRHLSETISYVPSVERTFLNLSALRQSQPVFVHRSCDIV